MIVPETLQKKVRTSKSIAPANKVHHLDHPDDEEEEIRNWSDEEEMKKNKEELKKYISDDKVGSFARYVAPVPSRDYRLAPLEEDDLTVRRVDDYDSGSDTDSNLQFPPVENEPVRTLRVIFGDGNLTTFSSAEEDILCSRE
eukprot:jgi/Mesvir1/630/Mv22178-RA.1